MTIDFEFETGQFSSLDLPDVPRVGDTVLWLDDTESEWTVTAVTWVIGPTATDGGLVTVRLAVAE